MYEVHLYIVTDSASTSKYKRKYKFILECQRKFGGLEKMEIEGEAEEKYNGIVLEALSKALSRMNQSCKLHIHTENRWVLNMFDYNLSKWAAAEFRNSKGEPVDERWETIWRLTRGHLVETHKGEHKYSVKKGDKKKK